MESDNKIFSFETPEESSGFLLWQVTNLWQREIKKALNEYGLTHSQFVLLASILWFSEKKENITQILLSNHTKIDPMTTSTVLRTLEKKELIQRTEGLKDTRAKVVKITNNGFEIAKLAVKKVENFDREFFEILGNNRSCFNKELNKLFK